MSSKAAKYYRNIVTIWFYLDDDEYGRVSYSAPIQIKASWQVGGKNKYADRRGQEFTPSSIVWTELRDINGNLQRKPEQNDMILLGASESPTPDGEAYAIVKVMEHENSILDGANYVPDYDILTG